MLRPFSCFATRELLLVTTAALLAIGSSAVAAPRSWDANGASPPNGSFNIAANWNPDVVPIAGDAVTFGISNTYAVNFSANAASDSATFSVGNVTLRSDSAAARNYNLTTGAADLIVQGSLTTINIGATGNPLVVTASDTVVGAGVSGVGAVNVMTLAGSGTSLTTGTLFLGDGDVKSGQVTVRESAVLTVTGTTTFFPGLLTINGGQATLNTIAPGFGSVNLIAGSFSYVGDLTVASGGLLGSNLTLSANRNLTLTGTTTVAAANTLTISGGSLSTGALTGSGALSFTSGTLSVTGAGGLTLAAITPIGSNVSLATGRTLNVTNTTTIDPGSLLTLDGGTFNTGGLTVNGEFVFNRGTLGFNQTGATINAPIISLTPGTTININATNISLGSASSLSGFNHQGVLNVGANIVTLNSAGYSRLGVLTTLAGGSIFAPNGLVLPSGGNLQGFGTVSGRIAGELGSVIEVTASAMALGDSISPAGFNFAGELRTKQNTLTLVSTAAAGLGNLTTLGSGGSPGTLNAANGFVVDFDEAVTGFGTMNSTNTLAKRSTINGTVQGDSIAQPITLSGYIKGTGTINNVTFTGTYSPGLSPTITTAGNLAFASTNTLIMELGGTAPGSGYDQIQASGLLTLGGTLQVDLTSGFTPSAGQSFNFFDWGSVSGAFSSLALPTIAGNLMWNASQLYTDGVLRVTITGDYNHNGTVDAADYTVWRNTLNQTGIALAADGNRDGQITRLDFDVWKSHYGSHAGGTGANSGDSVIVPEPLTILGFILGILTNCCSRRRIGLVA